MKKILVIGVGIMALQLSAMNMPNQIKVVTPDKTLQTDHYPIFAIPAIDFHVFSVTDVLKVLTQDETIVLTKEIESFHSFAKINDFGFIYHPVLYKDLHPDKNKNSKYISEEAAKSKNNIPVDSSCRSHDLPEHFNFI
ncbi:hypothetical protein AB9T89_10385 [Flavobacterium oncorhynchi]|uniref:hypothetical protein n=1 Tax=Flavobacterium oncorhynchi TaxID=728056 RepID=UPI00351A16D7